MILHVFDLVIGLGKITPKTYGAIVTDKKRTFHAVLKVYPLCKVGFYVKTRKKVFA